MRLRKKYYQALRYWELRDSIVHVAAYEKKHGYEKILAQIGENEIQAKTNAEIAKWKYEKARQEYVKIEAQRQILRRNCKHCAFF